MIQQSYTDGTRPRPSAPLATLCSVTLFQQDKQSHPYTCNKSTKTPTQGAREYALARYTPIELRRGFWSPWTGESLLVKGVPMLRFEPWQRIGDGVGHCGALVGLSALRYAGFKDPNGLTIPAPSVKDFLHGTSFHKGCWQGIVTDKLGPSWVVVEAGQWIAVEFDYFPESQLKTQQKLLDRRFFHRQPTPSGVGVDTQGHLKDAMGDLENPPPGTAPPETKSGCK
jgi:hypothetical protein